MRLLSQSAAVGGEFRGQGLRHQGALNVGARRPASPDRDPTGESDKNRASLCNLQVAPEASDIIEQSVGQRGIKSGPV